MRFLSTKQIILCSLFAALTAICAAISIPLGFTPAPITLQVFAVFLTAIILGGKLGFISQIIYVFIGAIGFPVFSFMTGGLQKIAGPTGGYITSLPFAALIVGYMFSKKGTINKIIGLFLGLVCIYSFGAVHFSIVSNVSILKAVSLTILPFIPLDILKIALAYFVGIRVSKSIKSLSYKAI